MLKLFSTMIDNIKETRRIRQLVDVRYDFEAMFDKYEVRIKNSDYNLDDEDVAWFNKVLAIHGINGIVSTTMSSVFDSGHDDNKEERVSFMVSELESMEDNTHLMFASSLLLPLVWMERITDPPKLS